MFSRILTTICVVASIFVGRLATASEIDLTPRYRRGQLVRVDAEYDVAGSLTVAGSEQPVKAPLAVSARSRYDERLLSAEPRSSRAGKRVLPSRRSVRYYSPFNAKLVINGEEVRPKLRAGRRLIAVSLVGDSLTMHSPNGSLSREELDLVQWPGDSLAADALLPSKSVAVGDKWQIEAVLLAALLNIGSVGQSDVTAELIEANGDFARIDATGTVHGAVDGASTTIDIKSRCYFDLRRHAIQSIQFVMNEKRKIGEVTPGVEATSKIKVKFTPITQSEDLSERALLSVDLNADAQAEKLDFIPVSGGYRLLHDRDWHVTKDERKAAILRKVEQGDVLGQCNITNLPVIREGRQVTLKVFQDDVRTTLGKNFRQFVNAGEFADEQGRLVYHVEAVGNVAGMPIRWRYYLLAKTNGRRTALVFTMDEEMVERFGEADRQLLAGLELLAPKSETRSPAGSEAQAKGIDPVRSGTDQEVGSHSLPAPRVGRSDDAVQGR